MIQEAKDFLRTRQKVNLAMVIINIAVFLLAELRGDTGSVEYMLRIGAAYTPAIRQGEYWRMFTAMFLHFGLVHLVYNMICLMAMGDILEQIAGPVRYLAIYLLGGLAGNALSLVWDERTGRHAVSAGASGAVFAVIGAVFAFALLQRRRAVSGGRGHSGDRGSSGDGGASGGRAGIRRGGAGAGDSGNDGSRRNSLPGTRGIPDYTRRMAVMVALMVAQGFTEAGTDNAAHIGGVAAGFLLGLLLLRPARR